MKYLWQIWILGAFLMAGCQKADAPPAPATPPAPAAPAPPAPAVAAPAVGAGAVEVSGSARGLNVLEQAVATAPGAEAASPEPEVHPCKNCGIDMARRLSGVWRDEAKCLPEEGITVSYPVEGPVVEVTAGAQKGMRFNVEGENTQFQAGTALDGSLGENAQPGEWGEAVIWATDAEGHRCVSFLAIHR